VLVVAAALLAAGMVLAGRGAGASVPAAPRRAAGFDGRVRAAVAVGGTICVGGAFTHATDVDGRVVARDRLAAFSLPGGALDGGWRPSADGAVHSLRVGFSGTRVYVAGLFTRLGGDPAHAYVGALDAASGAVDRGFAARVGFPVHALTTTATSVYGAGDGLGGQLGGWTTAGAAKFPILEIDGGGQAIAVIGAEVYLGGHFDNICPGGVHQDGAGRSVCTGAGTTRHKLLSVDGASGRPTAWSPSANSPLGVFALGPVPGGGLAAGGDFTQVGGAANRHLALFG
jgi:hypothetical protein